MTPLQDIFSSLRRRLQQRHVLDVDALEALDEAATKCQDVVYEAASTARCLGFDDGYKLNREGW